MNLFFILLLIALIVAGWYVYQRLLAIEREIRADQRALATEKAASENSPAAPVKTETVPAATVDTEESTAGLTEKIMLVVENSPGMKQTELYAEFPEEDRRDLQKLLRELDDQGCLQREKKGSSYCLYPM